MEFILLFLVEQGSPPPEPKGMAKMTRYAEELASQGKLKRGAPLAGTAERRHVRLSAGRAIVSDGPFAETKEVIGGFWVVDVADRAEAIDIAGRAPHARHGVVEVHLLEAREVLADSGRGTPFLLAFHGVPEASDRRGSERREKLALAEGSAIDAGLLETASLADDPPPARIRVCDGKTLVTDGASTEAEGGVGGYDLVRVAGPAAAVELAKSHPHAERGSIEVREILFFDRT